MAHKGFENTPNKIRKNYVDSQNNFSEATQHLIKKTVVLHQHDIQHNSILFATEWTLLTSSLSSKLIIDVNFKSQEYLIGKIKVTPILKTYPAWEEHEEYPGNIYTTLTAQYRLTRIEPDETDNNFYTYNLYASLWSRTASGIDVPPTLAKMLVTIPNDRISYELRKQKI